MTDAEDQDLIDRIIAKNGNVKRPLKRDPTKPRPPRVTKQDGPGHVDSQPEQMVAVDPRILDTARTNPLI
jgi:hypothetical protein